MRFKKLYILPLIFFCFILTLVGCSSDTTTSDTKTTTLSVKTYSGDTTYPLTVEDMNGEVTIDKMPTRIISLSPSNTETVFALDAGSDLVGRTEYGNYPPEAAEVPSVGSYATPSAELIIEKTPDLVIASDYIDSALKTQIEATGAKVLVFSPSNVEDVLNYIVTMGQILNKNDAAAEVVMGMETDYDSLLESLESIDTDNEKTVFIDLGNYYSVGPGSLLNDELELIKAKNIVTDTSTAYPQLSVETIISDNPDVYISFSETVETLKKVPGFNTVKAFEDDAVYYYDGLGEDADKVERPGPRVIEGMKLLAQDIYPEVFK